MRRLGGFPTSGSAFGAPGRRWWGCPSASSLGRTRASGASQGGAKPCWGGSGRGGFGRHRGHSGRSGIECGRPRTGSGSSGAGSGSSRGGSGGCFARSGSSRTPSELADGPQQFPDITQEAQRSQTGVGRSLTPSGLPNGTQEFPMSRTRSLFYLVLFLVFQVYCVMILHR